MKRSYQRILTTHTGSLPRPSDLLGLMASQADTDARTKRVRTAVAEVVEKQADAGVNIVSDGEMSKPSFVHYVRERVQGFEGVAPPPEFHFDEDFPGYMAWRTRGRPTMTVSPFGSRPQCISPLTWTGEAALRSDINNFKSAISNFAVEEGFVPCASVGIIAQRFANAYYPSYEAFVQAIAEVMQEEYNQIAEAGFVFPFQPLSRLGWIPDQVVNFRGTKISLINLDEDLS